MHERLRDEFYNCLNVHKPGLQNVNYDSEINGAQYFTQLISYSSKLILQLHAFLSLHFT